MAADDMHARLARLEASQAALGVAFEKGVAAIAGKLDGIDGRLRRVESRSTTLGAVAGGVMAVGVTLIAARLKGGA
ncbi:MAG: hypothetical protein HZY79_00475 [Rhodoblastus sp.]|nr:MAG: hypothetical protein HZY79_00475 [Rhodoblastus sp.]